MSDTLANVRDRVRYEIDDRKPSAYTVSTLRLNTIINRCAAELSGRLIASPKLSPFVTIALTAGTFDYRVGAASDEHVAIRQMLRDSDGYELEHRSLEYMNEQYRQDTDQAAGRGKPVDFATWEDQTAGSAANTTRVRFGPTPDSTETTINAYRSEIVYTVTTDAGYFPFGTNALRILELMSAGQALATMPDDELAIRKLSPRVLQDWPKRIDGMVRDENFRRRVVAGQTQRVIEVRP